MITPEFTRYLLSQVDGEWEVALLCGNEEPTDPAYNRCTVNFEQGTNTEECVFGPYESQFTKAITGYSLYYDGIKVCQESVAPQTPAEAEISTFAAGDIKLSLRLR